MWGEKALNTVQILPLGFHSIPRIIVIASRCCKKQCLKHFQPLRFTEPGCVLEAAWLC